MSHTTKVSLRQKNPNKVQAEPSHEGFDIKQAEVSLYSRKMSSMNASSFRLTFFESSKIMNRNMMIFMWEPSKMTRMERFVYWLFTKVF